MLTNPVRPWTLRSHFHTSNTLYNVGGDHNVTSHFRNVSCASSLAVQYETRSIGNVFQIMDICCALNANIMNSGFLAYMHATYIVLQPFAPLIYSREMFLRAEHTIICTEKYITMHCTCTYLLQDDHMTRSRPRSENSPLFSIRGSYIPTVAPHFRYIRRHPSRLGHYFGRMSSHPKSRRCNRDGI